MKTHQQLLTLRTQLLTFTVCASPFLFTYPASPQSAVANPGATNYSFTDGIGLHRNTDIDPKLLPSCGVCAQCTSEPMAPPRSKIAVQSLRPHTGTAAFVETRPSTNSSSLPEEESFSGKLRDIELMVVYTTQAKAGAGGTENINSLIDQAVAEANQVMQNSEVNARLRLVHTAEVTYAESGNVAWDLARLTTEGEGFLDEVHTLRNTYRADLVCLVTESSTNYAGMANVWLKPNGGFSVVMRYYLTSGYIFVHELAHNFGCDHDRENTTRSDIFPYSHGYRPTINGEVCRTVMAYAPGRQIPYFSNPQIMIQGVPLGVPEQADNARTINETLAIVDSYRGIEVSLAWPPDGVVLPEGTTLTLSARVESSEGLVTKVEFFDGTLLLGEVRHAPFSMPWTGLTPGPHSLSARVTVEDGLTQTSSPIGVVVNPPKDDSTTPRTYAESNHAGRLTIAPLRRNQSGVADQRSGFLISVTEVPGATIALDATTDLVSWSPIHTNAVASGTWHYLDALDDAPRRFYRTRRL